MIQNYLDADYNICIMSTATAEIPHPRPLVAKQMTDAFPITEGQFVGLFSGCILYGIYLVTVGMSLRVLLWARDGWKARSTINWPMLIVVILMATFATLDVAVRLRCTLYVFIWWAGPGDVQQLLDNGNYWTTTVVGVDYVAETVIGDGMLVVGHPAVFATGAGGIVCGILTIYINWTFSTNAFANANNLWYFGCSGIAITLVLNILNTSMIVYRIWSINKQTADVVARSSRAGGSRLETVMRIVVESGVLYTTSVGIFFASYFCNDYISDVLAAMVVPIVGIAFNLIIIRVNWPETATDTTTLSQFECATPPADQGRSSLQLATSAAPDVDLSHENTVDVHVSHTDYSNKSGDDSTRLVPGTIV
ncbi:hypothetical protein A0H81_02383 [Grifola frondosa]|uniref:Uncharacterized protein n=1 Tax=Grifola frondosa TaxID=5627 RepID=A0A1C7MLP2_GRIFR|nr:hypothetical protein A0H81_02383 [Grifola frondosa]